MRVILLQQVPKVGKKYDIVDVSDGYAKNFLIRRGLGELALPKRVAEIEKKRASEKTLNDARLAEQGEMIHALEGVVISYKAKADEAGHLYKKIHARDIAEAVRAEKGILLAPEAFLLEEALHTTGEHTVRIEDEAGKATFTFLVVGE
jgi:large subunit ribosomal protein L9